MPTVALAHGSRAPPCTLLLCRRSNATFTVPLTGEQLPLAGVRVFATMNPAAAGGNRHQLPPSLAALFTHVRLAAPSDAELSAIATSIFTGCITEGLVREDHVASVLALHRQLRTAMEARDLGAGGGVAHVTLRNLIKVRVAFLLLDNSDRASMARRCTRLSYRCATWCRPSCATSWRTTAWSCSRRAVALRKAM